MLIQSLGIVWMIVSGIVALLILVPFIVPQQSISGWIPECRSKAALGVPCAFCGMTSSFYAISRGDWPGALLINEFSIHLYLVFSANSVLFVGVLLKKGTAGRLRGALAAREISVEKGVGHCRH